MTSAATVSGPAVIRLRNSPWQLGIAAGLMVVLTINFWFNPADAGGHWLAAVPVLGLVAVTGLHLLLGADLSPADLRIRRFGSTTLPWPEIRAITVERKQGAGRIAIWDSSGRKRLLLAPSRPFVGIGEQTFDRAFHTIGQYWLAHRDLPRPPAGY